MLTLYSLGPEEGQPWRTLCTAHKAMAQRQQTRPAEANPRPEALAAAGPALAQRVRLASQPCKQEAQQDAQQQQQLHQQQLRGQVKEGGGRVRNFRKRPSSRGFFIKELCSEWLCP